MMAYFVPIFYAVLGASLANVEYGRCGGWYTSAADKLSAAQRKDFSSLPSNSARTSDVGRSEGTSSTAVDYSTEPLGSNWSRCFAPDTEYQGPVIQKIGGSGITHPQACQRVCAQTDGCAFWTYYPTTSECYLRDHASRCEKAVKSPAISGPRACVPSHGQSCYEVDVDYNGYDEKKLESSFFQSAEECQLACQLNPECHFWTWTAAQRNCYLKNKDALKGRKRASGCVSGPRQCTFTARPPSVVPRPPPTQPLPPTQKCADQCYEHHTYYTEATKIKADTVSTPDACQRICQEELSCQFFSYFPIGKKCARSSTKGVAIPYNSAISGPKFCPMRFCSVVGVGYYGRHIKASLPVSFDTCDKLCQADAACALVKFEEEKKVCTLIQQARYVTGVTSGPKHCSISGQRRPPTPTALSDIVYAVPHILESCMEPAAAYLAPALSVKEVNSPEECQMQCQAEPKCKFWTFLQDTRKCVLQEVEHKKVANAVATRGSRSCFESRVAHCSWVDVEVYGKVVEKASAQDAEACQLMCRSNTHCSVFVYYKDSKICLLRQQAGTAPGTRSAPRFCGVPKDAVIVPRDTEPGKPGPGGESPHIDKPEGGVPDGTKPDDTKPDDTKPDDTKPDDTKPDDTKPDDTKPDDTKPDAEKPGEPSMPPSTGDTGGKPSPPVTDDHDSAAPDPDVDDPTNCLKAGYYYDSFVIGYFSDTTTKACMKRCRNMTTCNYFSFFRKTGRCHLHHSPGNKLSHKEAVSGPSNCTGNSKEDECLIWGMYQGGTDNGITKHMTSLQECHMACKEEQACNFFSFLKDKSQCKMFQQWSPPEYTDSAMSGPKNCSASETNPCWAPGTLYLNDSKDLSGIYQNLETCQDTCTALPTCRYYSFDTHTKKCTFFKSYTQIAKDEKVNSGSRQCLPASFDISCILTGYVRTPATQTVTVLDLWRCVENCRESPTCRYFSFLPQTGKCSLHATAGTLSPEKKATTGPAYCYRQFSQESCFTHQAQYLGKPLSESVAASVDQCRMKCHKEPDCTYFNFYEDRTRCELLMYKTQITHQPKVVCGWKNCNDFNPKTCNPLSCCTEGAKLMGVNLSTDKTFNNPKECYGPCIQNPRCTFTTFSSRTKTCNSTEVFVPSRESTTWPPSCEKEKLQEHHKLWRTFLEPEPEELPPADQCWTTAKRPSQPALKVESESSIYACRRKCHAHALCNFIAYNNLQGTCLLYESEGYLREADGYIFGSAWCDEMSHDCSIENVAVQGQPLQPPLVTTLPGCKEEAAKHHSRAFATYDSLTGLCTVGKYTGELPGETMALVKPCPLDVLISIS